MGYFFFLFNKIINLRKERKEGRTKEEHPKQFYHYANTIQYIYTNLDRRAWSTRRPCGTAYGSWAPVPTAADNCGTVRKDTSFLHPVGHGD